MKAAAPLARAPGSLARLLPGTVTFLMIFPPLLPTGIPDFSMVAPDFLLISVYHWTLYRPAQLPYPLLFLIGLAGDLATAVPVGLTSLLLLVLRAIMLSRRRFFVGLSFSLLWAGFAVAAVTASATRWLVGSLFHAHLLDLRGFVFQTVLTVACYPLFTLLLARLQRVTGA